MCNAIIVLCANYTWSYCCRQCAVQRLTRPVEISVPTALQWLQSYKYVNTNQHNALFFNNLIQLYCLWHVSNIEVLILRKICTCIFFDVLLTVHLSIFISVINQLDAQNFCFTISFISCLYMFRAHVLIMRRSKLHYTASGIITHIGGLLMMSTCARNM
jgi:hypothetical protein